MNECRGVDGQFFEGGGTIFFRQLVLDLRPALLQIAQLLCARLVQRPGKGGECQQAGNEQALNLLDSLE